MPEVTPDLLRKYFKADCSDQEKRLVTDWLADPSNYAKAKKVMEEWWEASAKVHEPAGLERLLRDTRHKIGLGEAPPVKQRWLAATWLKFAASILLLLTFSALFYQYFSNTAEDSGNGLTAHEQLIESRSGQVVQQTLPDGTQVWLNAMSKLTYGVSAGQTREVFLDGEAFFDVAEDPEHPFVVNAKGVLITVLGTAFNVKSYGDEGDVTTTLVRGKVTLATAENTVPETVEMKPDQQAVFSRRSSSLTLNDVDASKYAQWTQGRLVFENQPVEEVFRTLERWYGISIHVSKSFPVNCRLTARIEQEPVSRTFELLSEITGIQYTISDKEVFIEGNICNP